MASGMGLFGNTGRCFSKFEDFTVCMKGSDEPLKTCGAMRDNYLECLHGKAEASRKEEVVKQKIENERLAKEGGSGGGHGHGGH